MHRLSAITVPLLFAAACTTTTAVDGRGLDGLARPTDGEAVFLRGDDGQKLRVDPNTNIRFKRADGAYTPWVQARHLYTNQSGVFRIHRVELKEASSVEVHGLSGEALDELRATIPGILHQSERDKVLRIFGRPGDVAEWVEDYVALRSDQANRAQTVGNSAWWHKDEGRFRFGFGFGAFSRPIDGHGLVDAIDHGLDVELGLAFDDITGAEVKNFSGSRSLALVVGSAAVVAVIVAAAKDGGGSSSSPSIAAHATLHVVDVAVRSAAYLAYCGVHCSRARPLPRGAIGSRQFVSTTSPGPNAMAARRLFDKTARRRSDLEVIASVDGTYDLTNDGGFAQTAAVTARIRDFIEIGGGGRRVTTRRGNGPRYLAFARFGGTFYLDEGRRVGVAILGDLGGGNNIIQSKVNLGLRFRVMDQLDVGAFLFSPTYTVEQFGPDTDRHWTFPSGLEMSYAF